MLAVEALDVYYGETQVLFEAGLLTEADMENFCGRFTTAVHVGSWLETEHRSLFSRIPATNRQLRTVNAQTFVDA